MAEKSEGGKPTDFFVGVVDLFAILLPGALLTFFLIQADHSDKICRWVADLPEGVPRWAAFLIGSYILGHFIFAVGSFLLDEVYDTTYRVWFGGDIDKLAAGVKTGLGVPGKNECPENAPGATANTTTPMAPGGTADELPTESALAWATAFVRVQSAAAAGEIDRVEADSKFFRSLTALQLLSWPLLVAGGEPSSDGRDLRACWYCIYGAIFLGLFLLQIKTWFLKPERRREERCWWKRNKWAISFVYPAFLLMFVLPASLPVYYRNTGAARVIVGYAVLFLSVWRFMETRLKRTRLTYEFALVLLKWPAAESGNAD
jgi:hypothetical protein